MDVVKSCKIVKMLPQLKHGGLRVLLMQFLQIRTGMKIYKPAYFLSRGGRCPHITGQGGEKVL